MRIQFLSQGNNADGILTHACQYYTDFALGARTTAPRYKNSLTSRWIMYMSTSMIPIYKTTTFICEKT